MHGVDGHMKQKLLPYLRIKEILVAGVHFEAKAENTLEKERLLQRSLLPFKFAKCFLSTKKLSAFAK